MKNFGGKNQEKRLLTDTAEKRDPGSHLRHGLLMANVGLLLIIFSECDVLREGWHALLYIGGATLCVAGIILVWIGVLNLSALGECLPRDRGTHRPRKEEQTSLARNDLKTMAGLAKVREQSPSRN
jgi:hypothetical protein